MTPARSEGIIGSYESLLKIWDFFHECEKFRLFMSGAWRNEWKDAEFLSRVEEIPDLQ